jgi:histidyl-tRNA synthetase
MEVFVAPISSETKLNAFEIAQKLRKKGIPTDVELVGRKLKKILSFADNSGARFVVLVGARDLENGEVTIKDMETGNQEQIPIESVADVLDDRINPSK